MSVTIETTETPALDVHLTEVLAVHFDPDGGAPYWLERQRELGFDVRREIQSVDQLWRLGPMDDAMGRRPLEDFLPRTTWE